MKRLLQLTRRIALAMLVLGAVLAILTAATPQGRTAAKTGGFVFQVLPGIPVKPLEWFTAGPIKEEVFFPQARGQGVAEIYRPKGSGQRAAVVLFLGVNPAGRDDDRVVNLAEGLARSGMVVMVPWSESMTQSRIDPAEVDNLIHAFQYLRELDYTDPKRVGLGGFCVGASLSAVAAQDLRIRDEVAFLNLFGSYTDAKDLLKAIASRTRFDAEGQQPWEPSSQTWRTFRNHLIESVENQDDHTVLEEAFGEGRNPMQQGMERKLSPEGQVVYRLLEGTSLEKAEELLDQMPQSFQDDLRRISPIEHIEDLKATVLIMHDAEDNNVPAEESRRLALALKGRGDVRYTEFVFFQHMDPIRAVNPLTWTRDAFKLFFHLYHVIRLAS